MSNDKLFIQFLRTINTLAILVFLAIVMALIYVPLKPSIDNYLSQPKYSKSERAEMLKKRELIISREVQNNPDRVENGIHVETGLIFDENLKYIKKHCISCHSSKLIAQNKATRSGWKQMINWMQATQGLHDLEGDEKYVLDYLSEYYKPQEVGRRPNLEIAAIEWYILNLD